MKEMKTFEKQNYKWCFALEKATIFNKTLNDRLYDSCIDAIYPFI
jgi:hypothetical protein